MTLETGDQRHPTPPLALVSRSTHETLKQYLHYMLSLSFHVFEVLTLSV